MKKGWMDELDCPSCGAKWSWTSRRVWHHRGCPMASGVSPKEQKQQHREEHLLRSDYHARLRDDDPCPTHGHRPWDTCPGCEAIAEDQLQGF